MPTAFFIIYWLAHFYIWAVWGWEDTAKLFTAPWWFDETGHALAGVMGSYTILYYTQNYIAQGIFRIMGKFFLAVIIIACVSLVFGVGWEGGELAWDAWIQPNYFSWLGKAQADSADTTIDILVTTVFSILAMACYGLYNIVYKKLYPNEDEQLNIEYLKHLIHYVSREVVKRRRSHLKQIVPALRELIHTARANIRKK
ncbi:MAG: hypothetical protein HYT37_04555 [Candidatus Sungbacteria bacterium]|nr:hypothetical protein [Candidatus Sungbacteria bacterium]